MKAIEATATINDKGQLSLDLPLKVAHHRRVRVIVPIPEDEESDEELESDLEIESFITSKSTYKLCWSPCIRNLIDPISQRLSFEIF